MKRPVAAVTQSEGTKEFPDADWAKRFPILCEYLAHDGYEDGTLREQSVLSVREQDGMVLLSLSDKDLSRGLYRVGKNVKEAMEAMEKALANGSADWRPWKQTPQRGKK